jgi:6-phosphogluconolactonase
MSISIEVVQPGLYPGAVADEIIECAQDAIDTRGEFAVALSGGRTPGAVYRALTNSSRSGLIEWSKVKLFIGDERWVPTDDPASNANMVRETLLDDVKADIQNFHFVDTSLGTIEEAVKKYAETLQRELPIEDGVPVLDLALLGLGTDGHIASLFPGSAEVADRESLVVGTINPADNGRRVSLAPRVLLAAKKVLFIVRGESKRKILKRVFENVGDAMEIPALMIQREAGDKVTWYLDSAAAIDLPSEILGM